MMTPEEMSALLKCVRLVEGEYAGTTAQSETIRLARQALGLPADDRKRVVLVEGIDFSYKGGSAVLVEGASLEVRAEFPAGARCDMPYPKAIRNILVFTHAGERLDPEKPLVPTLEDMTPEGIKRWRERTRAAMETALGEDRRRIEIVAKWFGAIPGAEQVTLDDFIWAVTPPEARL
jgi:hypothetical protein